MKRYLIKDAATVNSDKLKRRIAQAQIVNACKRHGHAWGPRIDNINHDSPFLPQGLVGWAMNCTRCHAQTGRGEY